MRKTFVDLLLLLLPKLGLALALSLYIEELQPSIPFALMSADEPSLQIPLIYVIVISSLGGFMPLSGYEILRLYEAYGWQVLRQNGSHVIIGKGTERETIPMHRELKKGLEQKLLKRLGVKK